MHNILLDIVKKKQKDLSEQKKTFLPDDLQRKAAEMISASNFMNAFLHLNDDEMAIIAEIKLASPTSLFLGSESAISQRAIAYEQAGSDVISVITERHYFKGSTTFIPKLKTKITIPILQKDFVIDTYQIYEAKTLGSDAILLIARLVEEDLLKIFVNLCLDLGVEPVVEVHDDDDLKKALTTKTMCIAVNARDLSTFGVSISQACAILEKIPEGYIKLGFSGVQSFSDVREYRKAGAKGVLVGTSLMKSNDIKDFLSSLRIGNKTV